MIPADHVSFNDDDTAWMVFRFGTGMNGEAWEELARPCDTCPFNQVHNGGHNLPPCPDCYGTGRHTFTIEVECEWCDGGVVDDLDNDGAFIACPECNGNTSLRVSVVPDMVLPICDETDILNGVAVPANHVILRYDGNAWASVGVSPPSPITLPPAATPGMWAVKLEIHQFRSATREAAGEAPARHPPERPVPLELWKERPTMSLEPPPAPPKLWEAWISDQEIPLGLTRTNLVGWSFTDGGAFVCTNTEGNVWARQLRPGDTVKISPQS